MQNAISPSTESKSNDNDVIWVHDEFMNSWYPLDSYAGHTLDNIDDVAFYSDIPFFDDIG